MVIEENTDEENSLWNDLFFDFKYDWRRHDLGHDVRIISKSKNQNIIYRSNILNPVFYYYYFFVFDTLSRSLLYFIFIFCPLYTDKPGQCPSVNNDKVCPPRLDWNSGCLVDVDCAGADKCCSNGCDLVCTKINAKTLKPTKISITG